MDAVYRRLKMHLDQLSNVPIFEINFEVSNIEAQTIISI
jgi:hypothetical protein